MNSLADIFAAELQAIMKHHEEIAKLEAECAQLIKRRAAEDGADQDDED